MDTKEAILQFANEHWFLAFLVICSVYYLLKYMMVIPFRIINRFFRSRNIKHHGWPTNPLMDADGDIIHPKSED